MKLEFVIVLEVVNQLPNRHFTTIRLTSINIEPVPKCPCFISTVGVLRKKDRNEKNFQLFTFGAGMGSENE